MTGEDSGLKASTVEQAKFEYSPLGRVFNKGLNEDDKEGLLKRLENIKDKNEEVLDAFSKANNASKATKIKVNNQNNFFLSIIHSISLQSLKILVSLKDCHMNLCIKSWKIFI